MKRRANLPSHGSVEVSDLSTLLNKMAESLGKPAAATYRNTNGVYMKLMNFRRLDPLYIDSGKKGLVRGNKDEEIVWDLFSSNTHQLTLVSNAIRKASGCKKLSTLEDDETYEAPEGRILTRMHRYRERDRDLVKRAKQAAQKKHGRLVCEACGFDFKETYGARGEGLIEVHHTKPLHTVAEDHQTSVADLALLCANCHRIVHATRQWLTVQEVRALLRPDLSQ